MPDSYFTTTFRPLVTLVCAAKIAGKTARTLTKNENRLTKQKLSVDFRQPLLGSHACVGLEGTEEGGVVGKARIDVNLG